MPHRYRNHVHLTPFPHPGEIPSASLPRNEFGGLTGSFDHWTYAAHDGVRPDDNHVYLWLKVANERFEVAVNVHSSDRKRGNPSALNLQYALRTEVVDPMEWSPPGFSKAEVSYAGLGLKEEEFAEVAEGELRTLIVNYATTCKWLTAYGVTYAEGNGLHDVHKNSGNPPDRAGENRVNGDGALVFYFEDGHPRGFARWVFLKFATQGW